MAHRNRRRGFRPRCESLDDRLLLSASPTAFVQDQVLFVVGTDGDDVIDLTIRPFRAGGRQVPVVRVAGVPRLFPATRFDMVAINAGDGDDLVRIDDRGIPLLPVWIDGGAGNDTLIGGSGNDTILGGPGDDVIEAGDAADFIDGGPGHNLINGVPDGPPPAGHPPNPAESVTPTSDISPIRAAPDELSIALSADEWAIVDSTNQARRERGLSSLVVSPRLHQAARIHAANMVSLDRIAHELPGTETPTLSDRADAVGYRYTILAENLAFNYSSPTRAVEAWLESEGHRRNLLEPDITEIGVAVARNAIGQAYYVQVFGKPVV